MKRSIVRSLLCIMMMFILILVSVAFAEMQKVDEAELARTNASITGASVQDWIAGADNGAVRPETLQTAGALEKGAAYSPAASKTMDAFTLHIDEIGQEVATMYFSGVYSNRSGSITRVETRK